MNKYKEGDFLRVEWDDHWSKSSWSNLNEVALEGIKIVSIGWFGKENETVLVLYSAIDENKSVSNLQVILKNCITKITKIKSNN